MARKNNYKVKTFTLPDGTRKYLYGKTKKEVEEKYQMAMLQLRAGVDLKNHDTFGEFAQMWFNTFKRGTVTKAVEDQIKRNLNLHVMPHLCQYRMKNITPMQCKNVFTKMTEAGKSEATQVKVYQLMVSIFKVAEENGVIYKTPMTSTVKPEGAKKKKKRALTAAQTAALRTAVKGRDVEPFVALVLSTGLRKGEALGLKWENVDLTRRELHVRTELQFENNNRGIVVDSLKSAAAYRTVPFAEDAYKTLLCLWAQRDGDLVFHGTNGEPLSHGQFKGMWKAVPRSIAPDLTPHILRHTAITNWIASGLDVKAVQYLAGHASASVTMNVYADYLAECRYEDTRQKIQSEKKEEARAAALA